MSIGTNTGAKKAYFAEDEPINIFTIEAIKIKQLSKFGWDCAMVPPYSTQFVNILKIASGANR